MGGGGTCGGEACKWRYCYCSECTRAYLVSGERMMMGVTEYKRIWGGVKAKQP